jgi:extracellular elastinolytic metalloproteinase
MKKLFYLVVFMVAGSVSGQDFTNPINTYLNTNRAEIGLQSQDFQEILIDRHSYSESMNVENVYVIQQYQNIEIYNSVSSFAVRNGQVLNANLSFSENVSQKVNTTSPALNASNAIIKAAQSLGLSNPINLELVETTSQNSMIYSNGNISLDNIPVKLVFQRMEDNTLRLAWDLSIYLLDASHYYSVRVDAINGSLLETNDWVVSCNFGETNHSNQSHNDVTESILFSKSEGTMAVLQVDAQYKVYPLPAESPNHGVAALIADPSGEGDGSPFGWHDTDGVLGAEYTITRGNNVYAQDDINGNNGNDGVSADGGVDLNFDFDFDFTTSPSNSIEAATVNLFYMNNKMHDIWFQYGFNEESGNFQETNYSGLGNGSDSVNADAQDGSGTNNANFATPPDGANPRMQMFLWDGSASSGSVEILTINNGPLAGVYSGIPGGFGATLPNPPLTEDLILVEDDNAGTSTDPNDACDMITNSGSLSGKIAVIRRGDCEFGFKSLNAQNEGAVAVIMVNNVAGDPIVMGGGTSGGAVTIPVFMIDNIDGEAIISELGSASINGTISGENLAPKIDGDLDNGIVAHEYGHGISNRLTGGPSAASCLQNDEQMGEGWSDWVGLMLTIEPGDQGSDIRGIGTFATGEPTNGVGIRPAPYSTSFAINDYTYANTNSGVSQPHGIGFVWATMLWDLNWRLIEEYGFDSDLYNGTGGNNIAMQLVIDGMKLQTCSPGFVDGRDAILQADVLAYGGENKCLIWDVFANRGLGESADQGSSNNRSDQTEAFDIPASCEGLGTNENSLDNNFVIYPNPSNGNINIKSLIDFGDAKVSIFDLNGREVFTNEVSLQNTVNINAENLTTGLYILQINGADYSHSAKLIINN